MLTFAPLGRWCVRAPAPLGRDVRRLKTLHGCAQAFHFVKRWDVDRFAPPDFSSRDNWRVASAVAPSCMSLLLSRADISALPLRYKLLVFPGSGDGTHSLDYKTVNDYITRAFKSADFHGTCKVRQLPTRSLRVWVLGCDAVALARARRWCTSGATTPRTCLTARTRRFPSSR